MLPCSQSVELDETFNLEIVIQAINRMPLCRIHQLILAYTNIKHNLKYL